jgi:hypothetical protein
MGKMDTLLRHLRELRETKSFRRPADRKRDPAELVDRVRLLFAAFVGEDGEHETPVAELDAAGVSAKAAQRTPKWRKL